MEQKVLRSSGNKMMGLSNSERMSNTASMAREIARTSGSHTENSIMNLLGLHDKLDGLEAGQARVLQVLQGIETGLQKVVVSSTHPSAGDAPARRRCDTTQSPFLEGERLNCKSPNSAAAGAQTPHHHHDSSTGHPDGEHYVPPPALDSFLRQTSPPLSEYSVLSGSAGTEESTVKSSAKSSAQGDHAARAGYAASGEEHEEAARLKSLSALGGADNILAIGKNEMGAKIEKYRDLSQRASNRLPDSFYKVNERLAAVCDGARFNGFITFLICLNALVMGYEANYRVQSRTNKVYVGFLIVNVLMTTVFVTEISLRIKAFRLTLFFDENAKWNFFDLVVVSAGLYESIIGVVQEVTDSESSPSRWTSLRLLRLMKMLKMLRLVGVVRAFREMRIMTLSMLASVRSTLWAIVLILMITYMFAMVFIQGVAEYLAEKNYDDPELFDAWSSLGQGMLTLFIAGTGGDDWNNVAVPMFRVGRPYYYLFILYIIFFLFVVVNILTSLFVDHSIRASHHDEAMILAEHVSDMESLVQHIRTIFDSMDKDEEGNVTVDEFEYHLNDNKMNAFAASLDIEPYELLQFFKMVSDNGKQPIHFETFVMGCVKLRGVAKSADSMHIMMGQARLDAEIENLMTLGHSQLDEIRSIAHSITGLTPSKHITRTFSGGSRRRHHNAFSNSKNVAQDGDDAAKQLGQHTPEEEVNASAESQKSSDGIGDKTRPAGNTLDTSVSLAGNSSCFHRIHL